MGISIAHSQLDTRPQAAARAVFVEGIAEPLLWLLLHGTDWV